MTTEETLPEAIVRLGLSIRAEFVPHSRSRYASEAPCLNWLVTVVASGRDILTTDYMQGSGHTPASKSKKKAVGPYMQRLKNNAIAAECETGAQHDFGEGFMFNRDGVRKLAARVPEPSAADVLYCLATDADVLNYSGFDQWAGEFGMDTDSRKAEATYRACLEIALQLRNGIGDDALRALSIAAGDY